MFKQFLNVIYAFQDICIETRLNRNSSVVSASNRMLEPLVCVFVCESCRLCSQNHLLPGTGLAHRH